jgi:hypothetical protein
VYARAPARASTRAREHGRVGTRAQNVAAARAQAELEIEFPRGDAERDVRSGSRVSRRLMKRRGVGDGASEVGYKGDTGKYFPPRNGKKYGFRWPGQKLPERDHKSLCVQYN